MKSSYTSPSVSIFACAKNFLKSSLPEHNEEVRLISTLTQIPTENSALVHTAPREQRPQVQGQPEPNGILHTPCSSVSLESTASGRVLQIWKMQKRRRVLTHQNYATLAKNWGKSSNFLQTSERLNMPKTERSLASLLPFLLSRDIPCLHSRSKSTIM